MSANNPNDGRDMEPIGGRRRTTLPEDPDERYGLIKAMLDRISLSWKLLWDGRVGLGPKLIPVAMVAYLFSPIDFIPELLVGPVGAVDDIGMIVLALNLFIEASPAPVVAEHLRRIRGQLTGEDRERRDDGDVVDGEAMPLD